MITASAVTAAAERATDAAGVVSIGIGATLTLAPTPTATTLGLGDQPSWARAIGLADLALGPGLLAGRPRWPWMAARAALNIVIVRHYRARARGNPNARRAGAGAAAMTALTVVDAAVASTLFASRR